VQFFEGVLRAKDTHHHIIGNRQLHYCMRIAVCSCGLQQPIATKLAQYNGLCALNSTEYCSQLLLISITCWIYSTIKQDLYRPARNQGARSQYLIDDRWALGNSTSKLQCKWMDWPTILLTKQQASNVVYQLTYRYTVHAWIPMLRIVRMATACPQPLQTAKKSM